MTTDEQVAAAHKLDHTDPFYNLTDAVEYVCTCGWYGRAWRWNDHADNVEPLPVAPPPPRPSADQVALRRAALRRAIYGDRSGGRRR